MDSHFDVAIVGTGLAHALAAAALAKAGLRVVHVDEHAYYGAHDASLTAADLGADIYAARRYNVGLAPGLVPAHGPLIDALIASGVARYLDFRLIDRIALADHDAIRPVPTDKAAIFAADIPLLHKRRLMAFLRQQADAADKPSGTLASVLHAAKLPADLATAVAYALAFATRADDPAAPSLARLRAYLRSAGRYGPSPFLLPHYGGPGELAQAFCRAAAVAGAVYILGRDLHIDSAPSGHTLTIADVPDTLTADLLIRHVDDPSVLPVARAIAIIARPISFATDPEEATVVVFPPAENGYAVTGLITGASSMSCPEGSYVVYLSTPLPDEAKDTPSQRSEKVLRPYLTRLLAAAGPDPPAELYTETVPIPDSSSPTAPAAPSESPSTGHLDPTNPSTTDSARPTPASIKFATTEPEHTALPSSPHPPILPLFTHFYTQRIHASEVLCGGACVTLPAPGADDLVEDLSVEPADLDADSSAPSATPTNPRLPPSLPAGPDAAATMGARIFWAAIRALRAREVAEGASSGDAPDNSGASNDASAPVSLPDPASSTVPPDTSVAPPGNPASSSTVTSDTSPAVKRRAALASRTLWPPLVVRDAEDEAGW
ncbi:GDP dissociation inhibitor-domain-containing protein [Schizophyllum fasciatum]